MFCNKCGKEISEGAQVCGYCGTPVNQNQAENQQYSQQQVYGEHAPSYSGQSPNPSYSNPNNQYQNQSYQTNQYQSNSYQSSQYQSNPYQDNQYQNNQYQNNQYQNGTYGYGTPQNMDGGATGLGVASLILGIVSLLIGCCASTWWLTLLVAVLSIVFGILSIQKNNSGKGMAIAGIICSVIAIVFMLIVIVAGVALSAWLFSIFQ